MGLDMYLFKSRIVDGLPLWLYDPSDIEKMSAELHEKLKPYEVEQGTISKWKSYSEEIAYWRKAYPVCEWFRNRLEHNDDGAYYEVTEDDLEDLLEHTEDRLLETSDPDERRELEHTVDVIGNILNGGVVDWEKDVVLYTESW